jgi:hypothetical protein
MRSALVAITAAAMLAGCTLPDFKLIDRRTFRRTPDAPGEAEVARSRLPPLPLVTIQFGQEGIDWRSAVSDAADAARAQKPDVAFDVLTAVPTAASAADQTRALQANEDDAKEVANVLLYDGVDPGRIHLGVRNDPGATPREVRIYVR